MHFHITFSKRLSADIFHRLIPHVNTFPCPEYNNTMLTMILIKFQFGFSSFSLVYTRCIMVIQSHISVGPWHKSTNQAGNEKVSLNMLMNNKISIEYVKQNETLD